MKTTMVVRLHPGQERKLSGAEDKDEDVEEEGARLLRAAGLGAFGGDGVPILCVVSPCAVRAAGA